MSGTPYLIGSASGPSGGSTLLSVPVSTASQTGDAIVVGVLVTSAGVTASVSDSQGNSYGGSLVSSTANASAQVYAFEAAGATKLKTTDYVYITYSSNASTQAAIVAGDNNVSGPDITVAASGTSTAPQVATGTLNDAYEHLIAFCVDAEGSTGNVSYITAGTHTFTPTFTGTVDATAVGAGGGGGASFVSGYYGGSGGGGGSAARNSAMSVTNGTPYTATVGAGGTAGLGSTETNGGAGGTSSFVANASVTISAPGGGGGLVNSTSGVGAGGTGASGATATHTGGAGGGPGTGGPPNYGCGGGGSAGSTGNGSAGGPGNGSAGPRAAGGAGGSGTGGGNGGQGGNDVGPYPAGNGSNGSVPGGGGGGGGATSSTNGDGGAGAVGGVYISWTTGTNNPPTWSYPSGGSLGSVNATQAFLSAEWGTVTSTASVTPAATLSSSAAWGMVAITNEAVTVSITTTSVPNGIQNLAYSYTLTAVNGATPYTWSQPSGALPTGVTLSSAGVLSGTPTVAGTYTFVIEVTDHNSVTYSATYTCTIAAAPSPVASLALPNNHLTLGDSDFESGVGTWVTETNASAMTTSTAIALTGTHALQWTATAAGTTQVHSGLYPCQSSMPYIASGYLFSVSASVDAFIGVEWYTSGGSLISTVLGNDCVTTGLDFQPCVGTFTSPSNATQYRIICQVQNANAGDHEFLDLVYMTQTNVQVIVDWVNSPYVGTAATSSAGNSFCDTSMFVRMDVGININSGRQDSISEVQSGAATWTWQNDTGWFTKYTNKSPFYAVGGNITLSRRFQLNLADELGNWHTRADGLIADMTYSFDNTGQTSQVAVTTQDVLAFMNRQDELHCWTKEQVLSNGPSYHWSLDDPGNSVAVVASGASASQLSTFGVAAESSGNNGPALTLTRSYGASATVAWQDSSGGIETLADAVQADGNADGSEYWTAGSVQPSSIVRGLDSRAVGPYTCPLGAVYFTPYLNTSTFAVTIATNASPCVFTTSTASNYSANQPVTLTVGTGGSLPAPFTAGTTYYITSPTSTTFELAATSGGAAINSTSAGVTPMNVQTAQNLFTTNEGYQLNGQFKSNPMDLTNSANAYSVECWFTCDPAIFANAAAGTGCGPYSIIGLGSSRRREDILNAGVYMNGNGYPVFGVATYPEPPGFHYINFPAGTPTAPLASVYYQMFNETVQLPHHLVLILRGATFPGLPTVTAYLDNQYVGRIYHSKGTFFDSIAVGGAFGGYGCHNGNVQLVSIYDYAMNRSQIGVDCMMGQYGMWEQTTDNCIAQLASLANVPTYWNSLSSSYNGLSLTDYQDITGSNAFTEMQLYEQAEAGLLFINRAGQLVFHTRDWRMGYGAPDLYLPQDTFDGTLLNWSQTDQFLINEAGISSQIYQNGSGYIATASQDEYGQYTTNAISSPLELPLISWSRAYAQLGVSQYVYWPDPIMNDLAQWEANHASEPYFFPSSVEIDLITLSKSGTGVGISSLYALEIDNKIAPSGTLPSSFPDTNLSMEWFIEGINETITESARTITFYTSPAEPQQAWKPGDATYGVLGTTSRIGVSQADTTAVPADGKDVAHDAGPPYWPPTISTTMNNPAGNSHDFIGSLDIRGIHDNLQLMLEPPILAVGCESEKQAFATGQQTAPQVYWDTVYVDSVGGMGLIPGWPNWYVCLVPGFYDIDASLVWSNTTATVGALSGWIVVAKNAAQAVASGTGTPQTVQAYVCPVGEAGPYDTAPATGMNNCMTPTTRMYLGLGDMVACALEQGSGITMNSATDFGGSRMSIIFRGYGRTDDRCQINTSMANKGGQQVRPPTTGAITHTYNNSHTYSYMGDSVGNGLRATDGDCWQGTYSGGYYTRGSQVSQIMWPVSTIVSDWAGCTITSCELTCTNLHFWYGAGGTLMLGYSSQTPGGATWSIDAEVNKDVFQTNFATGQTLTFTIPVAFAQAMASGGTMFTLGDGQTQDLDYYGYWNGGPSSWTLTVNGYSG